MTIQEVGSGLHIEAQNLKFYLDNGLLSGTETESAGLDFKEAHFAVSHALKIRRGY